MISCLTLMGVFYFLGLWGNGFWLACSHRTTSCEACGAHSCLAGETFLALANLLFSWNSQFGFYLMVEKVDGKIPSLLHSPKQQIIFSGLFWHGATSIPWCVCSFDVIWFIQNPNSAEDKHIIVHSCKKKAFPDKTKMHRATLGTSWPE